MENIQAVAPLARPSVTPEHFPNVSPTLPLEQMYTLEIGGKVYRLSGASLLSDLPSYFTTYFNNPANANTPLLIDRLPVVFDQIQRHLQGYHVEVADEGEFARMFSDVHYYNLPRLKKWLFECDVFIRIGQQRFRIPKLCLMLPGNHPNYFTMTYNAQFQDPAIVVNILKMLRPPPREPLALGDRSPVLFQDILDMLMGLDVHIRDGTHRRNLAAECRFYHFKALEQRVVDCKVRVNAATGQEEIVMASLEDIVPRQVDVVNGAVVYSRPGLDQCSVVVPKEVPRQLVLQIDSSQNAFHSRLLIDVYSKATFWKIAQPFGRLFAAKLRRACGEDMITSEDGSEVFIPADLGNAYCVVNGMAMSKDWVSKLYNDSTHESPPEAYGHHIIDIHLVRSQWRFMSAAGRVAARCVRLEGVSDVYEENKALGWL